MSTVRHNVLVFVSAAFWILFNFYSLNMEYGNEHLATIAWFFVTIVVCCVVYYILGVWLNLNRERVVVSLVFSIFFFYNFQMLVEWLKWIGIEKRFLFIWVFLFAAVNLSILLVFRFNSRVYRVIAMMVFVGTFLPVSNILEYMLNDRRDVGETNRNVEGQYRSDFKYGVSSKRNVYLFVFDEYLRGDKLLELFNLDIREHESEMEKIGFIPVRDGRSNYLITHHSIPSTLSMNYLVDLHHYPTMNTMSIKMGGDNPTVLEFKKRGYRYIHAQPGAATSSSNCNPQFVDYCISHNETISQISQLLFLITPIDRFLDGVDREFRKKLLYSSIMFLQDVMHGVKKFREKNKDEPYFLYAHLMIPHEPLFTSDCKLVDGYHTVGDKAGYKIGKIDYLETITCLNRQMVQAMTELVSFDPSALVILQSDHGSGFDLPMEISHWQKHDIDQRSAALNTIRLPEQCNQYRYDGMTLVNTFRLVFGCLDGILPKYLDDRIFMTSHYSKEVIYSPVQPGQF